MTAAAMSAGGADNLSARMPPEPPQIADPDTMHPRAVEMAMAIREGATTFRAMINAGFTSEEIKDFHEQATTLARTFLEDRFTPDRLSEMVDKARVASPAHMPHPKGQPPTQAMTVAWNRYCLACNAYRLDAWDGQLDRCEALLKTFFRHAPVGPAVAGYVVTTAMKTMGARQ